MFTSSISGTEEARPHVVAIETNPLSFLTHPKFKGAQLNLKNDENNQGRLPNNNSQIRYRYGGKEKEFTLSSSLTSDARMESRLAIITHQFGSALSEVFEGVLRIKSEGGSVEDFVLLG